MTSPNTTGYGFIYLMVDADEPNTPIKIGMTKQRPPQRANEVRSRTGANAFVIHVFKCPKNSVILKDIENEIHQMFEHCRLPIYNQSVEWFDLSKFELANLLNFDTIQIEYNPNVASGKVLTFGVMQNEVKV